jgi:hypothetical protein
MSKTTSKYSVLIRRKDGEEIVQHMTDKRALDYMLGLYKEVGHEVLYIFKWRNQ